MDTTHSAPRLCLGMHGLNSILRARHIFADRTCRQATVEIKNRESRGAGLRYCQELMLHNLRDMETILHWTREHGIFFYRMTSAFAPHVSNPAFIPRARREDPTALAYSLEPMRPQLERIGAYARSQGIRLTFHPGQFTTLSAHDVGILLRAQRDLHFHCTILDMMGMNLDGVCVIHGGGTYGDRAASATRWVRTFNSLPLYIKQRVVLENDEESYSIRDVLDISARVRPFALRWDGQTTSTRVPVVFDLFHYQCYNLTLARRRTIEGLTEADQPEPASLMPEIIRTWGPRTVKMHLSQQKPGGRVGDHSDYIDSIPRLLLDWPRVYGRRLDLMIEAKAHEAATLRLKTKYKL
jgi:UV DNA damage endonuclease